MTEKATRRKTLHLGIIGPGLVGSEFLAQILAFQKAPTVARWSVSIVAISNSKVMSMSREDIQLEHWKDILSSAVTKTDLSLLADHVSSFKNGVLVDCTASDSVALQYESWIGRGLSIITPNKKAFSGSMESWKSLFHLASEKGVGIFHESTVG